MRLIHISTHEAAKRAHDEHWFDRPPGWLSGALSQASRKRTGFSIGRENRLRIALGLGPLPETIPTEPCRACGSVHSCDCDGLPGHPTWTPDKSRKRYRLIWHMPRRVLAEAIRDRRVIRVIT